MTKRDSGGREVRSFNDDELDSKFLNRRAHADSTHSAVTAVKNLKNRDFKKWMGSGILIRLTSYDGKSLAEEFTIRAEDMEEIKVGIIQSLRESLTLRRLLLQNELSSINEILEDK